MNRQKPNRDLRAGGISSGLLGGVSKELREAQSRHQTTGKNVYIEGSRGLGVEGVSRILFGEVGKELRDLHSKFQTRNEQGLTAVSQSVGNLNFFQNIGLLQRASILLAQKKSEV